MSNDSKKQKNAAPTLDPGDELRTTIQDEPFFASDTRQELSALIPEIDNLKMDEIFHDTDIEDALSGIDFTSMEVATQLDDDGDEDEDIIELDDLPDLIMMEESEHIDDEPSVDPFTASGMFVLPDVIRHAQAQSEPMTAEIELDDDEIFELDPSSLIELPSDVVLEEPQLIPQAPVHESIKKEPVRASEHTVVRQRLRVGLDALGGQHVELSALWGRWSTELRLETIEEPEARKRAAYLSLFGTMLRFHGTAGAQSAAQLEEMADSTLSLLRMPFMWRLVDALRLDDDEEFLAILERLVSHEMHEHMPAHQQRYLSLLAARLLPSLIMAEPPPELLQPLLHEHGVFPLVIQALFAHRRGDHFRASSFWSQCARELDSGLSETLVTLTGYINRQRQDEYVPDGEHHSMVGSSSRLLLTHQQHEACLQGQHLREAELIERLLELEYDEPTEEAAAHLDRLVTLRHALSRSFDDASSGLALDAAHAAAQASPGRLYHWLVLERFALEHGDTELYCEALTQQIRLIDDPDHRALVREQLARQLVHSQRGDEALRVLEQALSEAPEALPVMLTLGHSRIAAQDWSGVLKLRNEASVQESTELASAWRRADLLEHEGGDLLEILSLYRSARHEQPDSIHLFFCVERTLTRLGQWRGLQNLFESTISEHHALTEVLAVSGYMLPTQLLAARHYLPDLRRPSLEELLPLMGHDKIRLWDESILWHVVAQLVASQRTGEALEIVERVHAYLEEQDGLDEAQQVCQGRALLWLIYIKGWYLRDAKAILAPLRELLARAKKPMFRRFLVHSLVRLHDFDFLAQLLRENDSGVATQAVVEALLFEHHDGSHAQRLRLAAELAWRAGDQGKLCGSLMRQARQFIVDDVRAEDEHVHAMLRLGLWSQHWSEVATLIIEEPVLQEQYDPALLVMCNVLREHPGEVRAFCHYREHPEWSFEPLMMLFLAESSWRRADWPELHGLWNQAIQGAASDDDVARATLFSLFQVFTLEFGLGQHSSLLRFIRQWSDLGGEGAGESEMFLMLAAWYRASCRTQNEQDRESVATLLHELFGERAFVLLNRELEQLERSELDHMFSWYEAEILGLGEQEPMLHAYLRAMQTMFIAFYPEHVPEGWSYDEDAHELRYLADMALVLSGCAQGHQQTLDAVLRLSAEPAHFKTLHAWCLMRSSWQDLLLGKDVLDVLHKLGQSGGGLVRRRWFMQCEDLLARATREYDLARPVLRACVDRLHVAGASQAHTELMLLGGDEQDLRLLAGQGEVAALVELEYRAALGMQDWRFQHNLEVSASMVQQSFMQDPHSVSGVKFLDYIEELEPVLLASPWGHMLSLEHDMSRLVYDARMVQRLMACCQALDDQGDVGAHFKLMASHQMYHQAALVPSMVLSLAPDMEQRRDGEERLIDRAWEWSLYAFGSWPHDEAEMLAHRRKRWEGRARRAASPLVRAEMLYEVGRLLEREGCVDEALDVYTDSHHNAPLFVPSQIARARLLIEQRHYDELVHQWVQALEHLPAESDEARGLAFRIGFVYERELVDEPDALNQAFTYYERSLGGVSNERAAWVALVRVAFRLDRFDVAIRYLEKLLPACMDRKLKVAYHLQLADLYEHELASVRKALKHYIHAHELDSSCYVALLGILRTDASGDREAALKALANRLHAASSREALRLSDHLLLLCASSPAAEHLMRSYFPEHVLWRMTQFVKYLEHGEVHEEALRVLARQVKEPALAEVFIVLEQNFVQTNWQQPQVERLDIQHVLRLLTTRPEAEGVWLTLCSRAMEHRHAGLLARLVEHASRGLVRTPLERTLELTRQAMVLVWGGDLDAALDISERALERSADFAPAVKLAHLVATQIHRWPSAARWSAREAELSRVPAVVTRARLEASQIQRQYLGDVDAAINQLSIVLRQNPEHEDVFKRLKELLIQSNRVQEVLKLCAHRLSREEDRERRVEMLNEMADLAMGQVIDRSVAIRYLSASIKEKPTQVRRLRILAELYESEGQYSQALACYDAAVKLSREARLTIRMMLQMGHILERYMLKHDQAARLYERILEHDRHNAQALQGMVRIRKEKGDFVGALQMVHRLEKVVQTPEEMRKVRIDRLEVVDRGDMPTQQILDAAMEVLLYHPDYQEAADILREELTSQGRDAEIEVLFRELVQRALREHASPPIKALFSLARKLGLVDMAFNLSSIGCWLNLTSRDLLSYHDGMSKERVQWPSEPIDAEFSTGVLPDDLDIAFFEIVRRSSRGLLAACEPVPYSTMVKRRNRFSPYPADHAHQMARKWPALFGLSVKDVYFAESLPMGSAIVWDDGVRLLLDRQWEDESQVDKLLIRLGTQLSAWSMGVGLWSSLSRDAQVMLFNDLMRAASPSWPRSKKAKLPGWFSHEKFMRWVQQEGADRVAAYALELGSRLGVRALPTQFVLIELAMERLATVIMPDFASVLPHTVRIGVERGSAQRPWKYLLSPSATLLRQQVGVAIEREIVL